MQIERHHPNLAIHRIAILMGDGRERTIDDIALKAKCSPSTAMRELRKMQAMALVESERENSGGFIVWRKV